MYEPYERTVEFALIERIAAALREELGAEIEEQPALRDPDQAGQVNRAFRATSHAILKTIVAPREDFDAVLNWVLTRIAQRRLAGEGLEGRQVEFLLGLEPATRDDWLAFLILTTKDEIDYGLRTKGAWGDSPDIDPPAR